VLGCGVWRWRREEEGLCRVLEGFGMAFIFFPAFFFGFGWRCFWLCCGEFCLEGLVVYIGRLPYDNIGGVVKLFLGGAFFWEGGGRDLIIPRNTVDGGRDGWDGSSYSLVHSFIHSLRETCG